MISNVEDQKAQVIVFSGVSIFVEKLYLISTFSYDYGTILPQS